MAESPESDWLVLHDYGRWELAEDRQTIWLERPGIGNVCRSKNRAVLVEDDADPWIIQLEHKTGGPFCTTDCVGTGLYRCGVEVRLGVAVPDNVDLLAVCDPDSSSFSSHMGPAPTLGRPIDKSEPVICSSTPEVEQSP